MNYLGIDYGEKRIGLAVGDDEIRLAVPIAAANQPGGEARWAHLRQEVERRRIGHLVVGYPYHMHGAVSAKCLEVDAFIGELEKAFGLPVSRVDERLTSQIAAQSVPGVKSKGRSPKQVKAERRRGDLDSRAAAIILQDYLDALAPSHAASGPGVDS